MFTNPTFESSQSPTSYEEPSQTAPSAHVRLRSLAPRPRSVQPERHAPALHALHAAPGAAVDAVADTCVSTGTHSPP